MSGQVRKTSTTNQFLSYLTYAPSAAYHSNRGRGLTNIVVGSETYVSFAVTNKEVTIMAVLVEHRVTLSAGDAAIVPWFAREVRAIHPVRRAAVRRVRPLAAPAPAYSAFPVRLRQIFTQLLRQSRQECQCNRSRGNASSKTKKKMVNKK